MSPGDPKAKAELSVFISSRDNTCDDCKSSLGRLTWISVDDSKRVLCLACADLDHLEYLPSGNAALTRRATKLSTLSAAVLKWSRARRRYERQGRLVEADALRQAEASCLLDADARAAKSRRRAEREEGLDQAYVTQFSTAIAKQFPSCPEGRPSEIAHHACRKYSGRVGRSAEAKALGASAIELAVRAHIRHRETQYDGLLARGVERLEARSLVSGKVAEVLARWQRAPG